MTANSPLYIFNIQIIICFQHWVEVPLCPFFLNDFFQRCAGSLRLPSHVVISPSFFQEATDTQAIISTTTIICAPFFIAETKSNAIAGLYIQSLPYLKLFI